MILKFVYPDTHPDTVAVLAEGEAGPDVVEVFDNIESYSTFPVRKEWPYHSTVYGIGTSPSSTKTPTLNFSAQVRGEDQPRWFFSEVPLDELSIFVMSDAGDTIQRGLS